MASIYKRGGTYTAQFSVNGHRRQIALGTRNKRTARRLLRELESAHEGRLWSPLTGHPSEVLRVERQPSLNEAPSSRAERIKQFLHHKRALKPRSIDNYRKVLTLYEKEGGDPVQFLSSRRGVTQLTYYRHLHVFYNWQVKQGWIAKNPCDELALLHS